MASKHEPEAAPDPDEDDLDDLDDVLDSFEAKPNKPATTSAPTASGPGRPPPSESAIDDAPPTSEDDLAKELQAGMASLISELGEDKDMQKQFEAMMSELIAAGQAPTQEQAVEHVKSASESMPQMPSAARDALSGSDAAAGSTKATKKEQDNFQETIRRTMERMQASDTTAKTASTSASESMSEEAMLMEMMKSLGAGGEGGGSEEDFNSMLMSMMTQLTNKEILYEPMKELHEKFPRWMEEHEGKEKDEEMARYKEQQRLVGEIVARFESSGYKDENEADREYIVERMQKMQAQGSPPPDLVGDMSAAQEALGDLDAGCPTQ